MNLIFILQHLEIKRQNFHDELGIIIFKPQFVDVEIEQFRKYCELNKITILKEKTDTLSKEAIIALYKNIFSYSNNDLEFGVNWKAETINYLNSGPSVCILVTGSGVNRKLSNYKYELRSRYGKITNPKTTLSDEDFKNKVIKNMVHVIDDEELQNGLWILFC